MQREDSVTRELKILMNKIHRKAHSLVPDDVRRLVTPIQFEVMIVLNIPLTVLTCAMIAVILYVSKELAGKSSRYFVEQQKNLGAVNGYIEEMMAGQKVVKVFCHEQENLEKFAALNEQLRKSADSANKFANIMMPAVAQLGNCSFALCSVAGALMAVNGWAGLTLGTLVSFLTLNRSFTQPFAQLSQQANSVVMKPLNSQSVVANTDSTRCFTKLRILS